MGTGRGEEKIERDRGKRGRRIGSHKKHLHSTLHVA